MFPLTALIVGCLIHHSAHGLPGTHIVGGTDAPDGRFPHQVSLKHFTTSIGRHFCGGAIISNRYIITAARCLDQKTAPEIIIGTGSNSLTTPNATYRADALIPHPNYNNSTHVNDIGLIRVSGEINFNNNTKSISLVSNDRNYDGVYLIASGWGQLWTGGMVPDHLQQITLRGCSQSRCSNTYKNITDDNLCTLGSRGEGMCRGDSGGPLTDGSNSLVGVVSMDGGTPCANDEPDVYTRVFNYKSWIDEQVNNVNAGSTQQSSIILGLFMTYLCIHSIL
jgi:trypsin